MKRASTRKIKKLKNDINQNLPKIIGEVLTLTSEDLNERRC